MCLMYILAIFCPPLVPLFLGYGFKHTFLNVLLCGLLWVPATIHAVMCIYAASHDENERVGIYAGFDIYD